MRKGFCNVHYETLPFLIGSVGVKSKRLLGFLIRLESSLTHGGMLQGQLCSSSALSPIVKALFGLKYNSSSKILSQVKRQETSVPFLYF
jgi:hypothetical protein